jgi:hypothetical protein
MRDPDLWCGRIRGHFGDDVIVSRQVAFRSITDDGYGNITVQRPRAS